MASTVIRVKRRVTDEPFDKFVLNCKRLKTNHNSEHEKCGTESEAGDQTDNLKTILKFATTVSAEDDIKTHLTKLRKCDAEEMARKIRKPTTVINRLRDQFKDDAQNSRFKIVNCFRSIEDDTIVATSSVESVQNVTVLDVIKDDGQQLPSQINENQLDSAMAAMQNADKFVYDLYLVDSGEQPIEIDISSYTIKPFDDLVYQANDETLDSDGDSEDSNDEANWRNDYPDTDDGLSIGEDDMRRAVEDLNFGSDEDGLSSDDDDCNYGEDNSMNVHFMNESDDNEYDYFKKHGHIRNHAAYYRNNRQNPRQLMASDDDSDIDDNPSSSSSNSSVSPLESCDED